MSGAISLILMANDIPGMHSIMQIQTIMLWKCGYISIEEWQWLEAWNKSIDLSNWCCTPWQQLHLDRNTWNVWGNYFGYWSGVQEWTDLSHHFQLEKLETEEIELLFIYQVCGIPIGNKPICSSIKNVVNGGMQSSKFGPDVFDSDIPKSKSGGKERFNFDTLKLSNIAHPTIEV